MKAEELMIGDWVHCITDNVYHKIYRLNIGDRYIADAGLYERESGRVNFLSDVDGIPITEEILLLNGINLNPPKQNTYEKHWLFPLGCFKMIQEDHEFWLFEDQVCIRYVHQLQQAFRLTGLYEYANNFKVTK